MFIPLFLSPRVVWTSHSDSRKNDKPFGRICQTDENQKMNGEVLSSVRLDLGWRWL